jgi:hypothetical protein
VPSERDGAWESFARKVRGRSLRNKMYFDAGWDAALEARHTRDEPPEDFTNPSHVEARDEFRRVLTDYQDGSLSSKEFEDWFLDRLANERTRTYMYLRRAHERARALVHTRDPADRAKSFTDYRCDDCGCTTPMPWNEVESIPMCAECGHVCAHEPGKRVTPRGLTMPDDTTTKARGGGTVAANDEPAGGAT